MSDSNPPEFTLQSIYEDGTAGEPEIVPVTRVPLDTEMDRRGALRIGGVLGAGISAAALLNSTDAHAQWKPKTVKAAPRVLTKVLAHNLAIISISISPDGQFLVSGDIRGHVKLWSIREAKLLRHTKMGGRRIIGLGFDGDSQTVTIVSSHSTRRWSVSTGKMTGNLNANKRMAGVAFSSDHKAAVFATTYGELLYFTMQPKMRLIAKAKTTGILHGLKLSADDKLLFVNKKKETGLYKLPGLDKITAVKLSNDRYRRMDASPDNKFLAVSESKSAEISFWQLPSLELQNKLSKLDRDAGPLYSFSTTEKRLRSQTRRLFSRNVATVRFFNNSNLLVFGVRTYPRRLRKKGDKETIRIWSADKQTIVQTLQGNAVPIRFALDRQDLILASAGGDGTIMIWERDDAKNVDFKFRTFLFDPATMSKSDEAVQYNVKGGAVTTHTVSYTLPCGSPIPAGATCTCNCVSGSLPARRTTRRTTTPTRRTYPSTKRRRTYTRCSCNKVCTCVPVCQAHKLLHNDGIVRHMAEQLLFRMGRAEFDYMTWAADQSAPTLRRRIHNVMDSIADGATPNISSWPSLEALRPYLDYSDEVVAIMAAQMSETVAHARQIAMHPDLSRKVDALLHRSHELNWLKRRD